MPDEYRAVVGGVDTHRDTHTAAAVDSTGRLLGTATLAATRAGYEELWGWLRGLGSVERVGVEGTSSYGAGLSRHLAAHDVTVIEVLGPKRRARRGHKCDPADAEAAARAVLSGEAAAWGEVSRRRSGGDPDAARRAPLRGQGPAPPRSTSSRDCW